MSILPGLSDHGIVQVLVNNIPSQTKQVPRNPPLQKSKLGPVQTNYEGFSIFQSELLTDLATTDVQELWDKFASRLE